MKKIVIEENSFLTLEDKYLPFVKEIIQLNENTPIRLNGNTLFFNEYTVGIIKLDDLIIEIRSRNEAITMNTIFEMYWFVNNGQTEFRMETTGFDLNNSFELTSVTDFFYKICSRLLQIGLTGSFNKYKDFSQIIRGNIVFEEYLKKEIPIRGLSIITEEYSINCLANQLIKAAISKLIQSEIKEENIIKLNSLLREFAYVDDLHFTQSDLDKIEILIKTFYSSNPYYPIVIETSLKILRDLKISYNNGNLEWYMFLVNSNDLFEKYVRKMLQIGMEEDVIKWKEPKKYATIVSEQGVGYKAFSPDIIIDYNETYDQGRVVLDVKNKKFNPSSQNISELVSPADLYQILFYCRQLKTNAGGIIYPTNSDFEPIKIEINDENDPLLYLFSINMTDTFENRLIKLKSEIKNKLLSYT
jgi:5-methylcytosine-specific restriction enzyme subunit McrC